MIEKFPKMTLVSCNTSSLAIYIPSAEKPWNQQRVNHVYRRLGYGANIDDINAALAMTPENFIDGLINDAINLPTTTAPVWANYTYNYYIGNGLDFDEETQNNHNEWRLQALNDLKHEDVNMKM